MRPAQLVWSSRNNQREKKPQNILRMVAKSTDPDIIWRHGLQVVLKGLPPFDGRLELVHFDQVVLKNEERAYFSIN